jgi:hypothetical protein
MGKVCLKEACYSTKICVVRQIKVVIPNSLGALAELRKTATFLSAWKNSLLNKKDFHEILIWVILINDQLDALFLNVFISCLYMFRATSAHHQEGQIILIHHLV